MDSKEAEFEAQVGDVVERLDTRQKPRVHMETYLVIGAMMLVSAGQILAILGSGLMAQPISKLFGNTGMAAWFGSIMSIFALALSPPISQAADYWGRKWFIFVLTTGGLVGFIIISRAQNMATVITGFGFLGLTFGAQPVLTAVVSEIVPREQRGLAQSSISIGASLGAVIGLTLGGQLLRNNELQNYRIYCYVAAGIFALGIAGIFFGYAPPPRELQSALNTKEKLMSLDWIGIPLVSGGLTLFVVGLQFYKNPYRFGDAHVLGPFIIGLIMIAGFGIYEWKYTKTGIMKHELFRHRNFPIGLFSLFVEGLAFYTVNSYFSFEAGVLYQLDTFESGLFFLVLFLVAIVAAFLAGWALGRIKATRPVIATGFTFHLIFNSVMAGVKTDTPKANFYGYAVFAGIGLGCLLPSILASAQLAVSGELISLATGLLLAGRSFGSAVGLTVNNAIFTGTLSRELPSKIAGAIIPLGIQPAVVAPFIGALTSSNTTALLSLPGVTLEVIDAGGHAMLEAYLGSFRGTWIAAACFSALGLLTCFFIKDDKMQFSQHIDAPVEADIAMLQKQLETNDSATTPRTL